MQRQTGFWPRSPSHQLPGSMIGPSHLHVGPEGASHLSSLGQYDSGVQYKSLGQSFLEAPLYSSIAPLEVGSAQLVLAESNACAGQTEPGRRHAISEQCPLRRVDVPPTNGSGNMRNLWQARGRPLRLRRQHSLPNLFFKGQGCVGPLLAQPPPLCFSPDHPDHTDNLANQGTEAQSSVNGPALEEPALVRGAVSAAHCSPVAHSPETRPPLSGKQNTLAPPAQTMGATSLASR